jgi:hypothetical protein
MAQESREALLPPLSNSAVSQILYMDAKWGGYILCANVDVA